MFQSERDTRKRRISLAGAQATYTSMPTFGTRYQGKKLLNVQQHVVLQAKKKIGCQYLHRTVFLMQAAKSPIHGTDCLESLEAQRCRQPSLHALFFSSICCKVPTLLCEVDDGSPGLRSPSLLLQDEYRIAGCLRSTVPGSNTPRFLAERQMEPGGVPTLQSTWPRYGVSAKRFRGQWS